MVRIEKQERKAKNQAIKSTVRFFVCGASATVAGPQGTVLKVLHLSGDCDRECNCLRAEKLLGDREVSNVARITPRDFRNGEEQVLHNSRPTATSNRFSQQRTHVIHLSLSARAVRSACIGFVRPLAIGDSLLATVELEKLCMI